MILRTLFAGLLAVALSAHAAADTPPANAVASAHPAATEAGLAVLAQGGNAFDAAVAVSAVLAVVEPYSSGLGGGGFWLLHRAADQRTVMIDGREKAPLQASRNMYLNDYQEVEHAMSIDGALAAAIPGEPAALAHIAEHYGRLPLAATLQAAIKYARDGFAVTPHYRRMAGFRNAALRNGADAGAIFLVDGEVPEVGHIIRQPDLAATLEALARHGRDGFYRGPVAEKLVAGVRQAQGLWQLEDLAQYAVVEREPVVFDYRGWRITSASLPSSGGIALATMLNVLKEFPAAEHGSVEHVHLLVEAMRRAYRDRAELLGDPDVVEVPVARLLSAQHAAQLAIGIDTEKATPSRTLGKALANPIGLSTDTTHFSILDTEGNRVAATLSINYPFGSGLVPAGTGVLLNDEMDDFSAKPGVPNAYGLVGTEANAIAPGKRMLSSMSPTFMENDDGVAILGTPGGSRIITMLLHGILGFVDGRAVDTVVAQPRFHHQYLPDEIQFEPDAFDAATRQALTAKGHQLKALQNTYGNMQAVYWDKVGKKVSAASDPRVEGSAAVR